MTAPIVIVGTGPAGISAAVPLAEAGHDILLLDADGGIVRPPPPPGSIGDFRRAAGSWRARFGASLAGLTLGADLSPKLATPLARAALSGYAERLALSTDGFHALGSLGTGGVSAIWGGMALRYDDADLAGFGFTAADLAPSYDAVAARIGLSQPGRDGPGLTRAGQHLAGRLGRVGPDLVLEPATNAVLMADRNGRRGCASCGVCLWGCERKSIYASADELPALLRRPNVTYRRALVRGLVQEGDGYSLDTDAGPIRAGTVLLAAGTIATTALAARLTGQTGRPIRLLTNPVAACAFLVPSLIGADLPEHSFSLAQFRHEAPLPGGGTASGALYGADTLPFSEIARRLPLSRPVALRASRALAPALLLATIYLPGRYSDNTIRVEASGSHLTGRVTDAAKQALSAAHRHLARRLRALGIYSVPGSFTLSGPGADAHYAGTVPMNNLDGELAPNLHLVDGAGFSDLPAKHCTLTIMANADRIARRLVNAQGRLSSR